MLLRVETQCLYVVIKVKQITIRSLPVCSTFVRFVLIMIGTLVAIDDASVGQRLLVTTSLVYTTIFLE